MNISISRPGNSTLYRNYLDLFDTLLSIIYLKCGFETGLGDFCTEFSRFDSGLSESTSAIFSFIYINTHAQSQN